MLLWDQSSLADSPIRPKRRGGGVHIVWDGDGGKDVRIRADEARKKELLEGAMREAIFVSGRLARL